MKYLRYFAFIAVCMFAASYSHAQVSVGVGVGGGYVDDDGDRHVYRAAPAQDSGLVDREAHTRGP